MAASNDGLRKAIEATNRNFMDTFARGDAGGIAKFYTAGGQILPSNSDPITGHEGIQGFWQAVMDMGIKAATLETVELEGHGDTAIEIGRYTLGTGAGQELDRGKYLVVWKQDGGQWKLHRDIWNTSVPAAS